MGALKIELNLRSGVPIYIQIGEQIACQVLDGTLQTGDQLPTLRQLAAELHINFNTVARAYRLLEEKGLLSTQQGRGSYILEKPAPVREEHLRQKMLKVLIEHYLTSARRLGFSTQEIWDALQEELEHEPVRALAKQDQECI